MTDKNVAVLKTWTSFKWKENNWVHRGFRGQEVKLSLFADDMKHTHMHIHRHTDTQNY